MVNKAPSLLRIHATSTLLVTCLNLGILAVILTSFASSQDTAGAALPFAMFAAGMVLIILYLTVRFKGARIRLGSGDTFLIYTTAMVVSLLLPFSVFIPLNSREALLEIGPMVFAQSLFLTTAIGIKMNTARHGVY